MTFFEQDSNFSFEQERSQR